MKIKAFSMLRVSSKGQIDGDGLIRQADTINNYCAANNIEIIQEFQELGVSGTKNVFDRPALSEMFEALKVSDVKLVLFETASRLARDLMISEILLAEFRKLNVSVIACDAGTELTCIDDNPTQILLRQLLSAISQFDKSCIVNKLRAARVRKKQSTGRCEGRRAYGANDAEKATIAFMADLRAQGLTFTAIAGKLNAESWKPRGAVRAGRATSWFASSVSKILARQ